MVGSYNSSQRENGNLKSLFDRAPSFGSPSVPLESLPCVGLILGGLEGSPIGVSIEDHPLKHNVAMPLHTSTIQGERIGYLCIFVTRVYHDNLSPSPLSQPT